MKRALAVAASLAALTSIGIATAGAASAAAPKGRHDFCVGTMDSNGTQHPIFCINLPPTVPQP